MAYELIHQYAQNYLVRVGDFMAALGVADFDAVSASGRISFLGVTFGTGRFSSSVLTIAKSFRNGIFA